ncbi:MAG TPA: hypothetical protein VK154_10705 [Chitinophagales bacterium]|nr:hypothetical protein [Chitinophagales bacterium]
MNNSLTLEELISEYKTLPAICAATDYSNNQSVKNHNRAADRMREIIELIKSDYQHFGTEKFQELLAVEEHRTNVWAAAQLLEILQLDKLNEAKALAIIKKVANGNDLDAIGFTTWLKEWNQRKK